MYVTLKPKQNPNRVPPYHVALVRTQFKMRRQFQSYQLSSKSHTLAHILLRCFIHTNVPLSGFTRECAWCVVNSN